MSDELKPCPFCGADEIEGCGEATWSQPAKWLYCTCCLAQGPRILMNRGEDLDVFMSRVKADWNQRYQPTEERQHDHPPQPSASVVEALITEPGAPPPRHLFTTRPQATEQTP